MREVKDGHQVNDRSGPKDSSGPRQNRHARIRSRLGHRLIYAGGHLLSDLSQMPTVSVGPYVLLGVALLIAPGLEFVNGFHDTANAVATVIYTHSLEPHVAVVWSGLVHGIGTEISQYRERKGVPQDKVRNFRNDMYVVSEALRLMKKQSNRSFRPPTLLS